HGGLYQVMLKGWRLYTQLGLRGLLRRIRALAGGRGAGGVAETAADYQEWVNRYDSWPAERLASLHEQVAAMPIQPRFIVTMPGASTGQPLCAAGKRVAGVCGEDAACQRTCIARAFLVAEP